MKVPQVVVGIRLEEVAVRLGGMAVRQEAAEAVGAVEAEGKAEEGTPRHRCCPIR